MAKRRVGRPGPKQTRLSGSKPFSKRSIESLRNDSPALYVLERANKPLYAGIAKRGRLQDRLSEHLQTEDVPGATKLRVRQVESVAEAKKAEERFIKRAKPPLNDQHNPKKKR